MSLRDGLLGTNRGYATFRRAIRADRAMETVLRDYIRPLPGQTILDIGCGPADLARMLPAGVRYIGIDHNPSYLPASAVSQRSDSVRLINADLAELDSLDVGHIDIAVAIGVLHHLDDDLARAVVSSTGALLGAAGRMVTVDPAFHPDQRASTRVMLALDRGRFVRHPSDYVRLLVPTFDVVSPKIRHDLLPIPYTHCVLEASAALGEGDPSRSRTNDDSVADR